MADKLDYYRVKHNIKPETPIALEPPADLQPAAEQYERYLIRHRVRQEPDTPGKEYQVGFGKERARSSRDIAKTTQMLPEDVARDLITERTPKSQFQFEEDRQKRIDDLLQQLVMERDELSEPLRSKVAKDLKREIAEMYRGLGMDYPDIEEDEEY